MIIERDTSTLWAWAAALAVVSGLFTIVVQPLVERWGLRQKWMPRCLELQRHVSIGMGTPKDWCDDEHCLRAWAGGILAFMFHATCGSLMLPVVIYGWGASETYQDMFLFGSLLDLGWDLFSQIQVYVATFHGDVSDRWGWARCPRGLFPFIVMHHALAYIIVVPMDNKYAHLPDYHQVCLSLLGAAACATIKMRCLFARALYENECATLDHLREAVTTLEDAERITRRLLGGAHPFMVAIEEGLREARDALRARSAAP
ncbi:unnamed protein product [Pelagomonas calceolata]|uniref:TLC domain-containing protein n=1 Tax=Pelagomonas calceolata TaxID=35677 RepID=A0A7S3ZWS5_9STRA|nr:unnamed protein product [Pelagomonas calceolata]